MSETSRRLLFIFGIAMCLAALFWVQRWINSARRAVVMTEASVSEELMLKLPVLLLGGFRGVVVTTLWIKAEDEKNQRRWRHVATYLNIISKLQPHFARVYTFNTWNIAYNLSVQWHTIRDKYRWILRGIEYCQEGIRHNPGYQALFIEMRRTYFDKLGRSQERDDYYPLFRADTLRVANKLAKGEKLEKEDMPFLLEGKPISTKEFPFGAGPMYFGAYYAKKARMLPRSPITQEGREVTFRQVATILRFYAIDEFNRGVDKAKQYLESSASQHLPDGSPARRKDLQRMIDMVRDHFKRATKIAEESLGEYENYFAKYCEPYRRSHQLEDIDPNDINPQFVKTYQRLYLQHEKMQAQEKLFAAALSIIRSNGVLTAKTRSQLAQADAALAGAGSHIRAFASIWYPIRGVPERYRRANRPYHEQLLREYEDLEQLRAGIRTLLAGRQTPMLPRMLTGRKLPEF